MVSASYSTNTLGDQIIYDFGNPGIITAVAQHVLSGGDLVQVFSGCAGNVGSQRSSYSTDDIVVQNAVDPYAFNGIVTQNAGSNTKVSIATKGIHLMRTASAMSGGYLVGHNLSGGVIILTQTDASGTAAVIQNQAIGKCWIPAGASGTANYSLIELK